MDRFDDFAIERSTFRLLRSGEPIHIEPKALELLIYLVEHRHRVVTKRELLDEIWKGTTVTENALTRAIAQIRKVLGDPSDAPRYIETVPTKGYRFAAELRVDAPGENLEGGENVGAGQNSGAPRPSAAETAAPPNISRPAKSSLFPILLVTGLLLALGVLATAITFALAALKQSVDKGKIVGQEVRTLRTEAKLVARPLHPDARLQVFPAFAPDRSAIAYAADDGQGPQIFARNLFGSEERQITSVAGGATQPAWSPDTKWVAYSAHRGGGIWIVSADGGTPQQLTGFGSRPAWSPDGTEIAFQSGDLIEFGWTGFDALPPSAIWLVNVKTKKARALTRPGTPAGGHGAPSWHPDSMRLAFTSCDLEHCGVYTVARDGEGITPIWQDPRRASSPVFDPDGRTLYFLAVLYNRSVLLAATLNSAGEPQGQPARLRAMEPGIMQHLAVSPSGKQFAWSVVEETSELMSVHARGGSPSAVTRNAVARTMDPSFSEDGTKIAYCAAGAGEDSGVWVANADGTRARGLAVGAGLKQHTQWLPGGFDVSYSAWRNGPMIFQASLTSGRVEPTVMLPRGSEAAAISPDAKRIAFSRSIAGGTSVWMATRDLKDLRQMTEARDLARFPTWSPHGDRLSVQLRRSRGIGILSTGDGAMRVLPWEGEIRPRGWSPDEKEIAFAGRRGGVWNIWAMSVATGSARQITKNVATTAVLRTPVWSPNGTTIVYESGTTRGSVWISEPRASAQ